MTRTIGSALTAMLATRQHTRARCLYMALRDGTVLGFTDHDRDLTVDMDDISDVPLTFKAGTGILPSDINMAVGLDADSFEVSGPLSADVTKAQILGKRFNRAMVRLFDVDWSESAPTFVAAGTAAGGTGTISPGLPSGWTAGDFHLLFVETANQALSAPSGWTPVPGSPVGTGAAGASDATAMHAFYREAASGDAAPTVGDSGDHQVARIYGFRGVDGVSPIEAVATSLDETGSTAIVLPSVTVDESNCMIVMAATNATDTTTSQFSGWTNSALLSVTDRGDADTTSGNGGGLGVASGVMRFAGATGTGSATLATSSKQARMTIALRADRSGKIPLMAGHVADAWIEGGRFKFEVRSMFDRYNQVIGRLLSPYCTADFGDTQCGVARTNIAATVLTTSSDFQFTLNIGGSYADDYFNLGTVQFLTGELAGTDEVEIFDYIGATGAVTLLAPLPELPQPGDTLYIRRGCSKLKKSSDASLPTCHSYDNVVNFRGFDQVPGSDQYLKVPVPGEG